MGRQYDKLVRDEIPAIIEEDGEKPIFHEADDEEYEQRLVDKLAEETAEYAESRSLDELADVLAVVHAIREYEGVSEEQLEARRADKAERRGQFEDRIVLERVES